MASTEMRKAVLDDMADGSLNQHSLFSAAIILSGEQTQTRLDSFEDQLDHFVRRASQQRLADSSQSMAHELLAFVHDQLLIGEYDAGCSDVRELFEDGTYNCVTATILYLALARRMDADWATMIDPVALPGHVRCQLIRDRKAAIPIETTSPIWPSETMAMHEGRKPRILSDVELLAKLIYNRGLDQMSQRDYESALISTELSWQFDQKHIAARENVVAVINNWALSLCGAGEFRKAIELLEQGQSLAPSYKTLHSNQLHVYLRWIHDERTVENHQVAAQVLAEAHSKFPDKSDWD